MGVRIDTFINDLRSFVSKLIFVTFTSSQKEDEIEEYLRKKYADESVAARHFGDGGEEMSDEITQQTLLPGVKDRSESMDGEVPYWRRKSNCTFAHAKVHNLSVFKYAIYVLFL